MKQYLPYSMIGLSLATAWSAYPEDMLLFGINLLLVVLWSYSAWLDAECRRI